MIAIRTRALTRVHDGGRDTRRALADVDLVVEEGEFVCVLGPSGSGKSTLLAVIGGLDRGYEGQVELFGEDLGRMSDAALARLRGERIGFVFQHFHLLHHLTVIENVTTPALFDPRADEEASRSRATKLLERLGLADRAFDTPAELSGGQRQRVAIARALLREPRLLLCDEPTGNLDAETGARIIELFEELHREERLTIVAVTHEERLARAATRILRLHEGRVDTKEHAP
ncbi:ABC transporter ATP-binding protein [Polyangium spumosum]|uniref:ABC transporter ATP-binding protein n=1 Tax=Polyangium spumosum TaxID=889282 RepID=UPI0030845923